MKLTTMGRRYPAAVAGVLVAALSLTACSGGDGGGDAGGGEGDGVELTFLIDNGEQTVSAVEALTAAYTE